MAQGCRRNSWQPPRIYYQGCIFAWNAYREAKAISSIKFDARKGLHKITE
jgi:hypothetical protein